MSTDALLQALPHDAPNLFLGSAFITVGLIAVAFSFVRGHTYTLLIHFGICAALWGFWLWVTARIPTVLWPHSVAYERLREGTGYLLALPTVLYFRSAGFMSGRLAVFAYLLAAGGAVLGLAVFAFGAADIYSQIFLILLIAAIAALFTGLLQSRSASNRDFVVIRRGLLVFGALVLWDNVGRRYFHIPSISAIGMGFLLACFGYVAARRTLQRDRQLSDIEKELELARRIQLSILPSEFPPSPHFEVAARYEPMTSVAGDFYEYVAVEDGRAGLLIADVSGHGVPAALIASMVKLAAASQRDVANDPGQFLLGMNLALWRNTQNQYVTAAYVHLDFHARELRYAAAAHPPMLLLRNGSVEEIEENGLMLGMFNFATYGSVTCRLEPGDRILLYTDGLIEAANATGEFFGREALGRVLKNTAGYPVSEASDRILSHVRAWSVSQNDDLTLVLCEFCQPQSAAEAGES